MEENKLSEFAKLIQEGKKAKQEAEENKKKNFLQIHNILNMMAKYTHYFLLTKIFLFWQK
mgnify:CR=1 FL=1